MLNEHEKSFRRKEKWIYYIEREEQEDYDAIEYH